MGSASFQEEDPLFLNSTRALLFQLESPVMCQRNPALCSVVLSTKNAPVVTASCAATKGNESNKASQSKKRNGLTMGSALPYGIKGYLKVLRRAALKGGGVAKMVAKGKRHRKNLVKELLKKKMLKKIEIAKPKGTLKTGRVKEENLSTTSSATSQNNASVHTRGIKHFTRSTVSDGKRNGKRIGKQNFKNHLQLFEARWARSLAWKTRPLATPCAGNHQAFGQ
ncbi:hypothetical protein D6783_05305 [Candidatus Woesearchaeota archaeon]|nr:MAG: hypothetical protein D6783_05305 [Candidatus Woesearchaeota archaeon]